MNTQEFQQTLASVPTTLQAQLKELQKLNNKGRPYVYISNVTAVSTTTTTETEALATALISAPQVPQPMNIDTLAIGWDSNTALNYKYKIQIEGVTLGNPAFMNMSQASLSIDYFSGNVIPVPASAQINLYAYNFNAASANGNLQLYILGFLQ